MKKSPLTAGSIWRRWDLHLHAPGTKLSDGYSRESSNALQTYLEKLEASDVEVFGITDYFAFDTYFSVKKKYGELYPNGKKVFIPNIEFRLTETISSDGRNVHSHVLIDPQFATRENLSTLFNDLPTHITRNRARIRCSQLIDSDYEQATVNVIDLIKALESVFPDKTSYLIITAAGNDGLRGVDTKSPRSMSISDELDKASHAFFGNSRNTDYFLNENRYEDGNKAEKKPVFSASDAHSFSDLDRLSGDEIGYEATWVKGETTFRGLQQTLFEPKGRVHIGERPTVLVRQQQEATRFISRLRIAQIPEYDGASGAWFHNVDITFNPELTAIIGNKGSGKSAIADILGLLGGSRQEPHFSFLANVQGNRKFRQKGYAENFIAELVWASNAKVTKKLDTAVDRMKPEAVKYLPQNFFESLTNEIEVRAFREEIEEVVFSHVDEANRMGKANFRELEDIKTAQSKSDISNLKVRIRELNIQIVDLEKEADSNTKQKLLGELRARRDEHRALEKSKPAEIPKPDEETKEQGRIAEELHRLNELRSKVETRGRLATERLTSLRTEFQKLNAIKEAIVAIGTRVRTEKEELRTKCAEFGLDIDKIVLLKTDLSSLESKAKKVETEIGHLDSKKERKFSADLNVDELQSISNLRSAYQGISKRVKELQDTLSAPHKRYQRYVQEVKEIEGKMREVEGSEDTPKPNTIKYLERKIHYIDNSLSQVLKEKYETRERLSREVFAAKQRVRSFYNDLKATVESRLSSVTSREFEVTIDASFVPLHSFVDIFFGLVNRNVRGRFRGVAEGRRELEQRIADTDWDSVDSIIEFVKGIVLSIREEDVERQVKDLRQLYNELYSFEYFDAQYELRLGGKNLNQLSPGEKGLLLLVFYLHLDKEKTPLIIDQPEDNLDNDSIFSVLARCIREAKRSRQVILVTHNPNLAVGADAEQVLYVHLDKFKDYEFSYASGAIEHPRINELIVKVLEGTRPAFVQRRLKYQIG